MKATVMYGAHDVVALPVGPDHARDGEKPTCHGHGPGATDSQ